MQLTISVIISFINFSIAKPYQDNSCDHPLHYLASCIIISLWMPPQKAKLCLSEHLNVSNVSFALSSHHSSPLSQNSLLLTLTHKNTNASFRTKTTD